MVWKVFIMPEVLPGLSRRQLLATSLMAGASTFLTGSNFALAAHRTDPGWQAGNKSLAISVRQDGSFDLFVDNIFWLSSAAPALHLNGAWYHAAGTLTRVSCDRGFSRDKLGP